MVSAIDNMLFKSCWRTYLKGKTMKDKMFKNTEQWFAQIHSQNTRNTYIAGDRKRDYAYSKARRIQENKKNGPTVGGDSQLQPQKLLWAHTTHLKDHKTSRNGGKVSLVQKPTGKASTSTWENECRWVREQQGKLRATDMHADGVRAYVLAGLWMWKCATEDDDIYLWVRACVCRSMERRVWIKTCLKGSLCFSLGGRAPSIPPPCSLLRSFTVRGWWNVTEETLEGRHTATLERAVLECHFPSLVDHGLQRHHLTAR